MPWVKIDDHFSEHPKHAMVGPLGWGVWLAGLAYCNRALTDGFIPRSVARTLASFEVVDREGRVWKLSRTSGMTGHDIDADWVIGLLVEAGLWEEVPGGYRVHDYLDYQPSRDDVLREREKKREAGRKGGLASAKARRLRAEARGQAPAQAAASANAQADAEARPQATDQPGGNARREVTGATEAPAQALAQAPASADGKQVLGAGPFEAPAQARASAGAQAKSKPVPVPVPQYPSQENTDHHHPASLRSYTPAAPDDDDLQDDGLEQIEAQPGPLPGWQPQSFMEAEMAAALLGGVGDGVPREIHFAYFAATSRLMTGKDLETLHELRREASVEQIVRGIQRGAERARRAGTKPKSLRYFVDAIREVVKADNRPLGYTLPDPDDPAEHELRQRKALYGRRRGTG